MQKTSSKGKRDHNTTTMRGKEYSELNTHQETFAHVQAAPGTTSSPERKNLEEKSRSPEGGENYRLKEQEENDCRGSESIVAST